MRVLTGVLCLTVPVLVACGDAADGPARPDAATPTRALDTTTTKARRDAAPQLSAGPPPTVQVAGDPCEGTPRERVRRRARERRLRVTRGACWDDGADRVAGRHEALSLTGTTTRLLSVERRDSVPDPSGSGELRAASPQESLLVVVRLRLHNRRRSTLTLPQGFIVLGIRGSVGQTRVMSVATTGRPFGRGRSAVSIPPRTTRTVVLVSEASRTGPQLTDPGARVQIAIPDLPGSPTHTTKTAPGKTFGVGVFDLDR